MFHVDRFHLPSGKWNSPATLFELLIWLRALPGQHARVNIRVSTATSDTTRPTAISPLLSANLVTRTGTKRGTRYSAKE